MVYKGKKKISGTVIHRPKTLGRVRIQVIQVADT